MATHDVRVAKIEAEINQLHEELRKIVLQWTFGGEKLAREAAARTERRYNEVQSRLQILYEELNAL